MLWALHAAPGLRLLPYVFSPERIWAYSCYSPRNEKHPLGALPAQRRSIYQVAAQTSRIVPRMFFRWKPGKNSTWKSNLFRPKKYLPSFSGIKKLYRKNRRAKSRGFGNFPPPPGSFFWKGYLEYTLGWFKHPRNRACFESGNSTIKLVFERHFKGYFVTHIELSLELYIAGKKITPGIIAEG